VAQLFSLGVMRVTKPIKVAAVFMGVICLYLLSIGPSYRLLCKHMISQSVDTAIYYPVVWICRQSEFTDDMLHRYENLWYSYHEMSEDKK